MREVLGRGESQNVVCVNYLLQVLDVPLLVIVHFKGVWSGERVVHTSNIPLNSLILISLVHLFAHRLLRNRYTLLLATQLTLRLLLDLH